MNEAKQFENLVPEVTGKVLNELVKRKKEEKRWKKAVGQTGMLLIALFAGLFFYFILEKQSIMDRFSFTAFLSVFSDPYLCLFGLGLLLGFARLQYVSKKYEDADDDFEELRCEIIDRGEELWSEPEEWRNRYHIFSLLEQEHGINLFHK